jgi:hypothetical protein
VRPDPDIPAVIAVIVALVIVYLLIVGGVWLINRYNRG